MLYPKIRDIERSNKEIKIIYLISVIISLVCVIIDYLLSPKLGWSIIVIASIIYSWITIKYSISYNVNIASHTMFQTICISALVVIIDYVFGGKDWAFIIAIPIILILSNIIMLILTILKNKKYDIYAIYQSIIFAFSVISNLLIIIIFNEKNMILNWISLLFSFFNLNIVLIVNGKVMISELKRRFHV